MSDKIKICEHGTYGTCGRCMIDSEMRDMVREIVGLRAECADMTNRLKALGEIIQVDNVPCWTNGRRVGQIPIHPMPEK